MSLYKYIHLNELDCLALFSNIFHLLLVLYRNKAIHNNF